VISVQTERHGASVVVDEVVLVLVDVVLDEVVV